MKTSIKIFTVLTVLSFSAMGQEMMSQKHQMDSTKVGKTMMQKQRQGMTKIHKKVQQYTCPMHPDVITNKPGKCPKCGMTLVKLEPKKVQEAISDIYTCPMHPEVRSDKPGKCPICKMRLEKVKKVK